ncbi:ribokinase [Prolixibacteraceae bacterium Z1-6]|uniref:Ribokinase n=1 Tax=Draconibacterium aestuarii TaxID=2998507 RepID=A0A9X3J6X6_9BACT|nr:ribokinase [Prolixibacteraceae bacterium Z1-6]
MKKIVVIGSSNIDLIMKMNRLPEKGETVTGAEFFQVYGGKGANQAVAAARAGGNVAFISCVGEDAYASQMIQQFKDNGIDTSFVFRETGMPSGHALIMIGGQGENYISVAPGANDLLGPEKINEALPIINEAEMIVLQYEIPRKTLTHIINIGNEKNIPILWNFAPAQEFDFSYFSRINILVLNETEVGYLAKMQVENEDEAENAAKTLIERGVEKVIITRGAEGAFVLTEHEKVRISSYRVDAVDTTAAGDTFCGALAVALIEGSSLKHALEFASAAAAISVTRLGRNPRFLLDLK